MSYFGDLVDSETIRVNINGCSYFVLLYEYFQDLVINLVKELNSNDVIIDGILYNTLDCNYIRMLEEKIRNNEEPADMYLLSLMSAKDDLEKYRNIIRKHGKGKYGSNVFFGSLDWMASNRIGLDNSDIKRVHQIRKRRNQIVHQMLNVVRLGLDDNDASMIVDLISFIRNISKWKINEIDIPIIGEDWLLSKDGKDILGMDEIELMMIFQSLFLEQSENFRSKFEKTMGKSGKGSMLS